MPVDHITLPRLSFTYAEWLRTTSRKMHVRSPSLKALDILVDSYIRTPSTNNLHFLRNGLERWKQEHRGINADGSVKTWQKSKRNTGNNPFEWLDAEINGNGDTDASLGTAAAISPGMINARLGVIYLFSSLEVEDYFQIGTGGVLDLTTAALEFAGDAAGAKGIGTAKTVLEQVKDPLVKGAERLDERRSEKKLEEKQRVVNSRQLFESRTKAPDVATQKISRQLSDRLFSSSQEISRTLSGDQSAPTGARSESKVAQLADKALDVGPGKLRALCDFLSDKYLADAAPFIGAGLTTVDGLIKSIDAGVARWKAHVHGQGVVVLPGQPSTVVQSIKKAMDVDIGVGVYKTLKGGGQLAGEALSGGASSAITKLTCSLVEALVGTLRKLHDIKRMKSFFADARKLWQVRAQPNALQNRPLAFNAWYRRYALHTPAIAALTLNSGICGDKMRFLKLFPDRMDKATQQSAFDAGVKYVDELKEWCANYLAEVEYKFSSSDGLVEALIKPGYRPEDGVAKRTWGVAKGFIEG